MKKQLTFGNQTFPLYVGEPVHQAFKSELELLDVFKHAFVICDQHTYELYHERLNEWLSALFEVDWYIAPNGSLAKNERELSALIDFAIEKGIRSDTLCIAFGGNSILDLVGYFAHAYRGGLSYLEIPTTVTGFTKVLAGGPALHHHETLDILAVQYPPILAVIDGNFFNTLAARQVHSGMASLLFFGLAGDEQFFKQLYQRENEQLLPFVVQAIDIMAGMDQGLIEAFKLFQHALITASGFEIGHLDSMSQALMLSVYFSQQLGQLEMNVARFRAWLLSLGLPLDLPATCVASDLADDLLARQSNIDPAEIELVLFDKIGEARLVKVPLTEFMKAFEQYKVVYGK